MTQDLFPAPGQYAIEVQWTGLIDGEEQTLGTGAVPVLVRDVAKDGQLVAEVLRDRTLFEVLAFGRSKDSSNVESLLEKIEKSKALAPHFRTLMIEYWLRHGRTIGKILQDVKVGRGFLATTAELRWLEGAKELVKPPAKLRKAMDDQRSRLNEYFERIWPSRS